jgi:AcrR family transcriptional regulator
MATRDSLLEVTARLYAEHGWRGTTTRRIAEAAGVNEVTIFRQFGSKESLLMAAIEQASREDVMNRLPAAPGRMQAELTAWALAHHAGISAKRGIIRACLAEWGERPELAPTACKGGMDGFTEVVRYLSQARAGGRIGHEGSIEAAAVMLMNAVFLDAMTRDVIPEAHHQETEAEIASFVDLVLRGLGAKEPA